MLDSEAYRAYLAETHPALAIDDRRLGGLPSFTAPLDVREPLLPGRARSVVEALQPAFPRVVTPPTLFIGTPFERYDQTHLLETSPPLTELGDRAVRAARSQGLDVAVLTNVQPAHVDEASAQARGWVRLPSFPDTVIDLRATSFEAHLAGLPPGDRSGMRRNIRKFVKAGHRLERVHDASRLGSALYECYVPYYLGAAVKWQAHTRAYFAGLTSLGDAVRLTVARTARHRLIGFIVAFEDRDGVQAGRIGVHPDFHRRDAVYFRLLYHVLEDALARHGGGSSILSLEPTGYRMKRHLGARTVPLVNLVIGVRGPWRWLLRSLSPIGRRLLGHLENRPSLERHY